MATGTWGGALSQRVFRANIKFLHGGSQCQTGFHIRDVGINTLNPQDVADEVAVWATTQFNKTLHNTGRIIGIDAVNLVTDEGASVSPTNVTGTQPGTPTPSFITVPVSLKGSIRKRYGSGRMLWPVCSQESISGNVLVPANITMLQGVIDDFVSRFMGGPLFSTMRLVHLHDDLAPRGTRPLVPAAWYDVTSVRLNTIVSSLRRRKSGVGV